MTQRHPHSTAPGRSPSRTVAAPHAPLLAGDQANASQADPPGLTFSVSVSASQHLIIEVLRRPVEFTQYLSIRYTDRLAESGIEPSVGSRGDSYDNALAESVIGLYKTEVIRPRGPWRHLEAVEFATLAWVDWFNNRRLLTPIGDVPPAEYEQQYYQAQAASAMMAGVN